MKKLILILALFLPALAFAQTGITTITASKINNAGTQPLTGQLCATPAEPFVAYGGGNVPATQVCYTVTNGVLQSGALLYDVSLSNPANVCYQIVLKNSYGQTIQGWPCMQPSGPVYSFDNFVQANPPFTATSFTIQPTLSFLGAWSSTQAYNPNNVVNYNGSSYVALLPNTNVTPVTGTTWALLAQQGNINNSTSSEIVAAMNTSPVSTTALLPALIPVASNSTLGGIVCDGATINCATGGVISVTQGPIPASATVLGSNASGVPVQASSANIVTALNLSPTTQLVTTLIPILNQNTTGTAANVTGIVASANGGTGVASPTGYAYANGASAYTFSTTIPYSSLTGTPTPLPTATAPGQFLASSGAGTTYGIATSAQIATALSATPSPVSVSTLNATGGTITGNLKVEYAYPELDVVQNGGTVATVGIDDTGGGGTKWGFYSSNACLDSFIAQSGSSPNIVFYPAGQPAICNSPNNGSITAVDNLNILGTLTTPAVDNTAAQTSVTCATSGTAVFSMPEQGASYKKVIVYENACIGAASYTFPTAFSFAPQVLSQAEAATATTVSATAVTVTGVASPGSTGFLELDGY